MNFGLIFVGAAVLVVCAVGIIKLVAEQDDADFVMIRSVLIVIGGLLGLALLLEGISGTAWEGWLSTFTT